MELTKGQQAAVDAVFDHYERKEHMTICGYAGTGKSFLTKYLVGELNRRRIPFVLCAPTHQAKKILTKMSGVQAVTIHSLLKIHPETYEDQFEFKQSGEPELQDYRMVIVDEASMVDSDLTEILVNSIHPHCMILGIGDKKQIKPVRHEPGVPSPFFTDIDQVYLTEIVRQKLPGGGEKRIHPIVEVATEIREDGWIRANFDRENKTGILNAPSMEKLIATYVSKISTPEDLLEYRFLAHTNKVVDAVNNRVRHKVYNTDKPYVEGEYLVLQGPITREIDIWGTTTVDTLAHNGETVKILSIDEKVTPIKLPLTSTFDVHSATLTVERIDADDEVNKVITFEVLWTEHDWDNFESGLEECARTIKAQSTMRGASKRHWDNFWKIKGTYHRTKPLGACTYHKSQGSTVKGVCMYTQDLGKLAAEEARELLYVGTTRATNWVVYF